MKRIGLVLDGGGGKGAHQIGVWKAMRETGIDKYIKAVSGASVGGLNAALFVQGDYEKAERIWTRDIEKINVLRLAESVRDLIQDENNLDLSVFSKSPIECFIATFCSNQDEDTPPHAVYGVDGEIENIVSGNMNYFRMRSMSQKDRKDLLFNNSMSAKILLATSAMPILCGPQVINGMLHHDGGIKDNSPVFPLDWGGEFCDTVIIVHLDHIKGIADRKEYGDIRIYEIFPDVASDELGLLSGTLNFSCDHARRLIEAGYRDSLPLMRQLRSSIISTDISEAIDEAEKTVQQKKADNARDLLETEKKILNGII
ncbi:MAG TPA: patatin-like phospholipase family protein [Ruminococcus flavefaciens]|nr:patatin-like phospholipase family protein [Ruminococcus flavefaciens]